MHTFLKKEKHYEKSIEPVSTLAITVRQLAIALRHGD